MTTNYKELFNIQCQHTYFSDGICRSLRLAPTAQCLALLSRYGCLLRPDVRGVAVYCPTEPKWQSLNELKPLNFALTAIDGDMASFTDMGPAVSGAADATVFTFSNLTDYDHSSTGASEAIPLHPPGNVFANSLVPVHPPRFTYTVTPSQNSAALQIVDPLGNVVWLQGSSTQGLTSISIDLSNLSEGRYQLSSGGGAPYDFYMTATPAAAVWAFIDIYPARIPVGTQSPAAFVLSLSPRSSFWRYYIVSQSPAERTYQDYRIAFGSPSGAVPNGTPTITFSGPALQSVNGHPAWVFESEQPIPLYQYPGDHYALTLNGIGKNQSIPLPFAQSNTTRLNRQPDGTVQYYSELFVHL
jgi:hypothetical protein